ncbi:MAG: SPFH domain-containing protein [Polyangiales bacterium]
MSYRDETTALAEQNKALERELSEKNRELVALREAARAPHSSAPPPRAAAVIARRDRSLRLALLCAIAGVALLTTAVIASLTVTIWPPWDALLALAGASSVVLWLAAFAALLRGSYVIVPPELALVFSTGRGHEVTMPGHAKLIVPLAMTTWVDVAPRAVQTIVELRLRDDERRTFELVARAQPRETTESVLRFFQRFNSATSADCDEFVQSRLASAARSVLSQARLDSLDRDYLDHEDRLRSELQSSLDDVGLELVEVRFTVR